MLKGSTLKILDVRILRSLIETRGHQHFTTHTFAINSPSRSYMTFNDLRNKNRLYTKKELVGYSMQDMYDVVSDVSNYHRFVPYVKRSDVHSQGVNGFKADLIVGFPPLNEAYTSLVTLKSPRLVRSECHDGRLFNYLLNEWRFSPGLKDIPDSCVLDFKVAFEFKSLLHSSLAHLFFDFICDQMESAFIQEALWVAWMCTVDKLGKGWATSHCVPLEYLEPLKSPKSLPDPNCWPSLDGVHSAC